MKTVNGRRKTAAGWAAAGLAALWLAGAARAVTLAECIAAARAASPDVHAALARIRTAQAAIEQAESAYYPQLSVASTVARTDNPPQAFFMALNQRVASLQQDFNQPEDTSNWRNSVVAKVRLLDGGQRGLGRDMARLGADAARLGKAATDNELVHLVTRGYYSALQAQEFIQVQTETVASLAESLRVAQERLKAGAAVKTDVLNLEVKQAQARQDLIRARNGFRLAVAALNTTIGQELVPAAPLPVQAAAPLPPPPAREDGQAAEQRPELRAAELLARIQQFGLQKARRDYAPALSAFGSLDWDSNVNTDFQHSYMVGAVVEWDLFTGFRRRGATAEARARRDQAQSEVAKARLQLRLDLQQAGLQLQEAWERLGVAQQSLASAAEALRITQQRYQQGAAEITELLTAQVGLTATRTSRVAAYYDYQIAGSNLRRARGELAADDGGEPPPDQAAQK